MRHLLSIVLVTPLAGAVVLAAVGNRRAAVPRAIATAIALLTLSAAIPLWFLFEPRGDQWQLVDRVAIAPSVGLSYFVGIDGVGLLFILMTAFVAAVAMLASLNAAITRTKEYYITALALEASALGLFMALDFAMLALCWTVSLASMSALVGVCAGTDRVSASKRASGLSHGSVGTVVSASIVLMLATVVMLCLRGHDATGIYTFDVTAFHRLTLTPPAQTWPFLMLMLALAAAVAIVPVSAHAIDIAAAPGAASIWVTTSVMLMSVFAIARIALPIFPDASRAFAPALTMLALVGALASAAGAMVQREWPRLVALATVAQLLLVILALFALTPDGLTAALVQALSVSVAAAALCLVVALIVARGRTPRIADYAGLVGVVPMLAVGCLAVMLIFVGAPAFAGPRLIVGAMWRVSKPAAVAGALTIVAIAAAFSWLGARMITGGVRVASAARDLGWRDAALLAVLVMTAIAIDVYPAPVLARVETSVARVVLRVSPQFAPQVSDCLTAPPPKAPENSGLPAGMLLAAPCAEGTSPKLPPR